jgi:transcriptional regulator with XRE-family HTH domain
LKKSPDLADKRVGSRVRMRRLMLGMSQTTLAHQLGVTYQQCQKYEKGTNRIGASRLQQIAEALRVPVTFFFEGATTKSDGHDSNINELFATTEGIRLSKAFTRIDTPSLRRKIIQLVEELSKQ